MRISILICLSMLSAANGQPAKKVAAHPAAMNAVLLTPGDVTWMAAPPATGLPSAVQLAVLSGDPFKLGMFTVRLKIPDGGQVAAHWHPTDEHITVLQGLLAAGMGDKLDTSALHDFPVGSYVVMPKRMHHFAVAKGETIVQVTAMGPFVLNYVNPSDDPRKKK
jgi:quercetin dioxygenase-like cupin family protein